MPDYSQPLETSWHRWRFRSRLEARWAVFFSALGLEFDYEKEGYNLGPPIANPKADNDWYLPDFFIPGFERWIEIKPDVTLETSAFDVAVDKLRRLAVVTGYHGILICGPPQPQRYVATVVWLPYAEEIRPEELFAAIPPWQLETAYTKALRERFEQ